MILTHLLTKLGTIIPSNPALQEAVVEEVSNRIKVVRGSIDSLHSDHILCPHPSPLKSAFTEGELEISSVLRDCEKVYLKTIYNEYNVVVGYLGVCGICGKIFVYERSPQSIKEEEWRRFNDGK